MTKQLIAVSTELNEDLRVFSAFLFKQGIAHSVSEMSGSQVLVLESEELLTVVQNYYTNWKSGGLQLNLIESSASKGIIDLLPLKFIVKLVDIPMTLVIILASITGFILYTLDPKMSFIRYFTYLNFELVGDRLLFNVAERDLWRYVTPIFLHFSWLHVVFNCLWMWEIGVRIERNLGSLILLGLILVSAVISNEAQYYFSGPSLFGGMSGVIYALLGFSWVAGLLCPEWKLNIPMPLVIVMIVWLLLCMSGLIEILGFGAIANGAHLGGLFVGCWLGLLFGVFGKLTVR